MIAYFVAYKKPNEENYRIAVGKLAYADAIKCEHIVQLYETHDDQFDYKTQPLNVQIIDDDSDFKIKDCVIIDDECKNSKACVLL